MYENLWLEMKRRKITNRDIGLTIGKHENSVYNKIYGKTEFSLTEAHRIYQKYFSDVDFLWVFQKGGQSPAVLCPKDQTI